MEGNRRKFMRVYKLIAMAVAVAGCLVAASMSGTASGEFTVDQKDKTFLYKGAVVKALKVKVGDVVNFRNMDPFFHNVFSLSDARLFDLGSYPQGQSKSVTFEKAGRVEVECAIHPGMHMVVEVR
jgi:plastocyanin